MIQSRLKYMRLVTYQTVEAVEHLLKTGSLFIDKDSLEFTSPYLFKENERFKVLYDYICKNMQDLAGKSDEIIYPLWGWYTVNGRRNIPKTNDHFYKGMYRLEIEIDRKDVLLTDFDKYCYLLNSSYLPKDEKEKEWYQTNMFQISEKQREESYQFLFKIFHLHDGYTYFSFLKRNVQATFWVLKKEQIKKMYLIEE